MLIQSLNALYSNNCQCRKGNTTIFIVNKPSVNWVLKSLKGKIEPSYLCNSAEAAPHAIVRMGFLALTHVRFSPVFEASFLC